MNRYHHEQISKHTYKIVENDPYGQYPFLYAIMGVDKCVVIDTGTGIGDFAGYVDANINKEPRLPYLVINTHVHFDHVGGNHKFAARKGFRGVHMSGADKRFSLNLDINSLCMAHNCTVKHYKVDKWLKEGDTIYLDDSKQERGTSLEIIETPGHTPDSIAIYSHLEKLLFVGDNIYPYTVIHLDCIGSNVKSYVDTLKKLQAYIIKVEKDEPGKLRSPEEVEKSLLCQPCDDEEEEKGNGDVEAKIDSSSTVEVESKEEQSNEKDEENHRKDAIANKEEKNDDRNSNETNNKQCATEGENKNSKSADDEDDTRSCTDNSQAENSINNKNKKENKSSEIIAGQKGKKGGVSSNSNNKQRDQQEEKSKGPPPAAAAVLQEQHPHQKLIDDFCQLTGQNVEALNFSIDSLMQISNYNVNEMLDMFFTNGAALSQICPPNSGPQDNRQRKSEGKNRNSSDSVVAARGGGRAEVKKEFKAPERVRLCCGHVEAALDPKSIEQLLALLEAVKAGALYPSHVDSGYGEFTNGTYSLMMKLKPKW